MWPNCHKINVSKLKKLIWQKNILTLSVNFAANTFKKKSKCLAATVQKLSVHSSSVQIHIINSAYLEESPWEEMADIENFLGIPNKLSKENFFLTSGMKVHL